MTYLNHDTDSRSCHQILFWRIILQLMSSSGVLGLVTGLKSTSLNKLSLVFRSVFRTSSKISNTPTPTDAKVFILFVPLCIIGYSAVFSKPLSELRNNVLFLSCANFDDFFNKRLFFFFFALKALLLLRTCSASLMSHIPIHSLLMLPWRNGALRWRSFGLSSPAECLRETCSLSTWPHVHECTSEECVLLQATQSCRVSITKAEIFIKRQSPSPQDRLDLFLMQNQWQVVDTLSLENDLYTRKESKSSFASYFAFRNTIIERMYCRALH